MLRQQLYLWSSSSSSDCTAERTKLRFKTKWTDFGRRQSLLRPLTKIRISITKYFSRKSTAFLCSIFFKECCDVYGITGIKCDGSKESSSNNGVMQSWKPTMDGCRDLKSKFELTVTSIKCKIFQAVVILHFTLIDRPSPLQNHIWTEGAYNWVYNIKSAVVARNLQTLRAHMYQQEGNNPFRKQYNARLGNW